MSWAPRRPCFTESRSPVLRHELLVIAREVAADTALDMERFEHDRDSGRYKASTIADSRRGWHELTVGGSPTVVLPDGRRVSGPAGGEADIDAEHGMVRRFAPVVGDPLAVFRALRDTAAQGTG